jgi:hypothetical protein
MDKPRKSRALNAQIDAIQRNLRELWRDLSRLPREPKSARRKARRTPRK